MKRKTIVTVFFTLTALLLSGGKAEGQQQETLARSSSPTARYAAEETGLPAAAPWTLQECIRYAQENNIEIQTQLHTVGKRIGRLRNFVRPRPRPDHL